MIMKGLKEANETVSQPCIDGVCKDALITLQQLFVENGQANLLEARKSYSQVLGYALSYSDMKWKNIRDAISFDLNKGQMNGVDDAKRMASKLIITVIPARESETSSITIDDCDVQSLLNLHYIISTVFNLDHSADVLANVAVTQLVLDLDSRWQYNPPFWCDGLPLLGVDYVNWSTGRFWSDREKAMWILEDLKDYDSGLRIGQDYEYSHEISR